MWHLTRTLLSMKFNCRPCFSAFFGSQLWERMIQYIIICRAQPFPKQNISLNVSLSPMCFAQNILSYSCGHDFKGKNALPLMLSSNSLHVAITSCLLSKRNFAAILIQSCHVQECLVSVNVYGL